MMSLLEKVEDFKEFLFVDELNEKMFQLVDKVKVLEIGKSTDGYPIFCARLGNGNKNALIFGFPHPNEPVGSLTCLSLIKILLENEKLRKKFTWYIIPCADPDGAKLNENWFKGGFTIKKYAYNFYRSKPSIQTEWSFPVEYKDYKFDNPPANTSALKNLMEEIKPDLIYPLHNAGFEGAFFYITKPMSENYYNKIFELCKSLSIPLNMGEPEAQFIKELKKPIYLEYTFKDYYDYYKSLGKEPKEIFTFGNNTIGFAQQVNSNVFGLIGEIPYIFDPKINDVSKTNKTRRVCLSESASLWNEMIDITKKILNHDEINKKSIFYDMLKEFISHVKNSIEISEKNLKKDKYNEKATVAEEFSKTVRTRFFCLSYLGEVRRLLLDSDGKEINDLIKEVESKVDGHLKYIEKNSDYKIIPIRNLVQLQLECLFISLDYI
ncbi:MAG: hypothetical protein KAT37_03955 [Candidatus Aenigmarchaeota archaeon]|nr:hypothetical protein [Candidatus Aenigmarchaeota archaeon]